MDTCQQLLLKKWLLFTGCILTSLSLFSLHFWGFSLPWLAGYYFSLGLISTMWAFKKSSVLHNQYLRALSLDNPQENAFHQLLTTLCEQANIARPNLLVNTSSQNFIFQASAWGWPYPETIIISEPLLKAYQVKLSQQTVKALLAHEISHIKNFDLLNHKILSAFKHLGQLHLLIVKLFSSLVLCAFLLRFTQGALLIKLILNYLLFKCFSLLTKVLQRLFQQTQEFIADLDGAHLIHDPRAAAYFHYELFFHHLEQGKVILNEQMIALPNAAPLIEKYYEILTSPKRHVSLGEIYYQFQKRYKPILPTWQLFYQQLFKTHPPTEARKALIESAFSHAF